MKEIIKNLLVGLEIFGLIAIILAVVISLIDMGFTWFVLLMFLIPMFYILGKEIRGK